LKVGHLEGRIHCRAGLSLAAEIADADDPRQVQFVQEVLQGDETAKIGGGIGAGDQLKLSTGGSGAGPLGVYTKAWLESLPKPFPVDV
jgi:hypothetical protein